MAAVAYQYYAMFLWMMSRRAPLFPDGVTKEDISEIMKGVPGVLRKLEEKGPSSILLALDGGLVEDPRAFETNMSVERLILLALLAERPHLIPRIIETFPTGDPTTLAMLLEPFLNPNLETYAARYMNLDGKTPGSPATVLAQKAEARDVRYGIAALGRIRIQQNLVLRNAVRARYCMVEAVTDPHVFTPASLSETESLVTLVQTALTTNPALYTPLQGVASTLKRNFELTKTTLVSNTALTEEAKRRLRLLLSTMNTVDLLFEKMTSGSQIPTGVPRPI